MLTNIKQFFKAQNRNILLFLVILLLCLLAFGAGMLVQFNLEKPAVEFEQPAGLPTAAPAGAKAGE